MKECKTVWKHFIPWQFDGEVYDLERASEKGWQLIRRTKRRRMYAYNPAVRYRYAIDYQYDSSDPAYLSFFKDQGWEPMGFIDSGFYLFRKPYDPALPEEAYYIYTDEASLQQMKQMYTRTSLCGVGGALFCFVLWLHPWDWFLWGFTVDELLWSLAVLWEFIFTLLQRRCAKRLRPGECKRRRMGWSAMWVPFLLLLVLGFVSSVMRPTGTLYSGSAADVPETIGFTVTLPDFYRLEITEILPDGSNAVFTLTDGDGTVLASDLLAEIDDWTEPASYRLFLTPGDYTLSTSLDAAAPPGTDTSAIEGDILYVLN